MTEKPTIGHNNPPSKIDDLLIAVEKAEAQAAKVKITDDESAGNAGTLIKVIRENVKVYEQFKKEEKIPFNQELANIENKYRPLLTRLQEAIKTATTPLNIYMQKKAAEERAEAARLAKIAEEERKAAVKANMPPPEPEKPKTKKPSVTSSYGHTVSMRTSWSWEIVDEMDIPIEYYTIDTKKIDALVKSGTRKIDGIKIFSTSTPVVR